jgi:hypothetical protein
VKKPKKLGLMSATAPSAVTSGPCVLRLSLKGSRPATTGSAPDKEAAELDWTLGAGPGLVQATPPFAANFGLQGRFDDYFQSDDLEC